MLLQGCVMVPRTVASYDPSCQVVMRKMELQAVQIASIQGCSNQGCVVLIGAAAVTAAASTAISGSIMVLGNMAYWLEERGQCLARSGPA
jgi:hypothetical protein